MRLSKHGARGLLTFVICLVIAGVFFGPAVHGNPNEPPDPDATRVEIRELEGVIQALDKSIKEKEARLDELEAEIKQILADIAATEKELDEAEERFEEQNILFADRVRSAYIRGGLSYLGVLLQAESFGDLIVRAAYLQKILSRDAGLIDSIKEELAFIDDKREKITADKAALEDRQYQIDAERRNLLAQRKEQEALLKATKDRLAVELAQTAPQANRLPVYAVILDNHTSARPQAGLSRASLVYEYEVEGRITRYLALFAELPNKVGPIRSARTHSAMLALENKVHFIYASASRDVLATIAEWQVPGTNALASSSSSIYRDRTRRAPHNLFVNLSTLKAVPASSQVVVRPAFVSKQGTAGNSLSIEYGSSTRVQYRYDKDKDTYQRYLNGALHRDAGGRPITARNVVVQYVPHHLDFRSRPTPDLIGSGRIEYYVQGQYFKGTWSKSSHDAPTHFYYEDGRPIEFVYGPTWIQIVRAR